MIRSQPKRKTAVNDDAIGETSARMPARTITPPCMRYHSECRLTVSRIASRMTWAAASTAMVMLCLHSARLDELQRQEVLPFSPHQQGSGLPVHLRLVQGIKLHRHTTLTRECRLNVTCSLMTKAATPVYCEVGQA